MSSSAPRAPCRPPNGDGDISRPGGYTDPRRPPGHTPLEPTCRNTIVVDTIDALIIVQNCIDGTLNHVARRPGDKERESLIVSGNVFCYEENSSGIKRWTDGVHWSPSRILGNCLVYRELDGAFPPGEKKKANKTKPKRNTATGAITRPGAGGGQRAINPHIVSEAFSGPGGHPNGNNDERGNEPDRKYIGSLYDSYPFKEDGLVKKTISFVYRGVMHHLVSYYTLADAKSNRLVRPVNDSRLLNTTISQDFWENNYRTPLDQELNMFDNRTEMHAYFMSSMPPNPASMLAMVRPGPPGPPSPQFFPGGFPPNTLQVSQHFFPDQHHLQNHYRHDQHNQPHNMMDARLPLQYHPQHLIQAHAQAQAHAQSVQFHREGAANAFPDTPLNDPSKQHQQHTGQYIVPGTGNFFGHSPVWHQQAINYTPAVPLEEGEFDEHDVERTVNGLPHQDPNAWPINGPQ